MAILPVAITTIIHCQVSNYLWQYCWHYSCSVCYRLRDCISLSRNHLSLALLLLLDKAHSWRFATLHLASYRILQVVCRPEFCQHFPKISLLYFNRFSLIRSICPNYYFHAGTFLVSFVKLVCSLVICKLFTKIPLLHFNRFPLIRSICQNVIFMLALLRSHLWY